MALQSQQKLQGLVKINNLQILSYELNIEEISYMIDIYLMVIDYGHPKDIAS